MPEGDTIHRTANALRTALVGHPVLHFAAPRNLGPAPELGSVVERIESHGKHLEITFDDGIVLHTHMRMTGSWHLYRIGERWRRPSRQSRVVIEVADWVAVCFNAPVVETYRLRDRRRHPGFGSLGPDLCREGADLAESIRRMRSYDDPSRLIAEVLLDQRVMCGVGNVYRCEVLWACEVSPFAPVGTLPPSTVVTLVETAAEMLRANLDAPVRITAPDVPGGLAVYGRHHQPCPRCGDSIAIRRVGEQARLLYWCPGCQTAHHPDGSGRLPGTTPADGVPRPVDQLFLDELPWRRSPA
jgi:endonuclease VIII